jgi:hypothetical protein
LGFLVFWVFGPSSKSTHSQFFQFLWGFCFKPLVLAFFGANCFGGCLKVGLKLGILLVQMLILGLKWPGLGVLFDFRLELLFFSRAFEVTEGLTG